MTRSRNLRSDVSQELVGRGYRRSDRMHLNHVGGDWHFWVDTGPLGKRADITPFVGIRNDVLENLVSEFLSLPPDDNAGSLGANIGYVLDGKYREWQPDGSVAEVLGAIGAAFERLRPLMALDRFAEGWKIEGTHDPLWRYREILLLSLVGDATKAKARLNLARDEFCRHEDALASRFREFEQRLLSRFTR